MENNKLSKEEHHRRKPQTKQPEHDIRIYLYTYFVEYNNILIYNALCSMIDPALCIFSLYIYYINMRINYKLLLT